MRIVIVTLVFFCACTNTKPETPSVEAVFNVDSSLMQELPTYYSDSLVSFHLPEEFESYVLSSKVEGYLNQRAFISEADSSIIMLAELEAELSDIKLNEDVQANRSTFIFNNLEFIQYVIQDQSHVNFKLFFSPIKRKNKIIYNLEYIVKTEDLNAHLTKIESSIGSLNLNLN